jgi:DNA-directed RNA polymerase beta subunit
VVGPLPADLVPPEEPGPGAAEPLTPLDAEALVLAAADESGLVQHVLGPFNELVETGIQRMLGPGGAFGSVGRAIKNERATEPDHVSTDYTVAFEDVSVDRPLVMDRATGSTLDLYPSAAMRTGEPYSGALSMAIRVELAARYRDGRVERRAAQVQKFRVAGLPVMVRSVKCNTHGLSPAELRQCGEDPRARGGWFIAGGQPYVVELLENIVYNMPHIHLHGLKQHEVSRCEFISQPGTFYDNSSQVRISHMDDGGIVLEINSTALERARLPFFVIFRLFGANRDDEVARAIAYDPEARTPAADHVVRQVVRAFQAPYDRDFDALRAEVSLERTTEGTARALQKFSRDQRPAPEGDDAVREANRQLMATLDQVVFPHMGTGEDARRAKVRFLGRCIHLQLLTERGVLPPADRDSLRSKRVHGAAISLAKVLKTQINIHVVAPIRQAIQRQVAGTPFGQLQPAQIAHAICSALRAADLDRAVTRAITAGNKQIAVGRQRTAMNRVSSQPLEPKNEVNVLASLRNIVPGRSQHDASKQTERADRMRRVHPSYAGYVCPIHSADTGEKVGMRKQLALTAAVTSAGDAALLEAALARDPAVRPLAAVRDAEIAAGAACVLVNGKWVGCCASAAAALALAQRYRALRRAGRVVERQATVCWSPVLGDVSFWLDAGRLVRPLLVVRNNWAAFAAERRAAHAARRAPAGPDAAFRQWVAAGRADVRGLLSTGPGRATLAGLAARGLLDYISPEEAENCLVAPSPADVAALAGDARRRYTHCDLPLALLGLTAVLSPFGQCTAPARILMETNQGRQAGTWYDLGYKLRPDMNRFMQARVSRPLVATAAQHFTTPAGQMLTIAYMPWTGNNQEDSAYFCAGSRNRGLLSGVLGRTARAVLEKDCRFGRPPPQATRGMRPDASYEHIGADGLPRVGDVLRRGDVVIGRFAPEERGDGPRRFQFVDRSVVHQYDEPAVVESVSVPWGGDGVPVALVRLRFYRPLAVGDKLSSRAGNKTIVSELVRQSDMPYDDQGETPDMIVNPHSFPKRMVASQLIEAVASIRCARLGETIDGTTFLPVSVLEDAEALYALGFRANGKRRLYRGDTGEAIEAAILQAPLFEQRLLKFATDNQILAGDTCPTDATTGQPLNGKSVGGGLRMSEMDAWCLGAHGAMLTLRKKFHADSDGRMSHVCRRCGELMAFNPQREDCWCPTCGDLAEPAAAETCKAAVVLRQEIESAGISMRTAMRPPDFLVDPPAHVADAPPADDADADAARAPPGRGEGDAARAPPGRGEGDADTAGEAA